MLGVSEGKRMCAALEKIWFTIADMIVDLRGKGVVIPHEASVALDGAKVLLNLCKYHPNVALIESHVHL